MNLANHCLSLAPASSPSIVAQCRCWVLLRPLPLHYPRTTAFDETKNNLQCTVMLNSCFHMLFGKEVCLSAALMSWNAVHDLAGMFLWCVEKPATVPHNLPCSGGRCGVFTIAFMTHTNPWPRLRIRTWITCWLLWFNRIWSAFKQCQLRTYKFRCYD